MSDVKQLLSEWVEPSAEGQTHLNTASLQLPAPIRCVMGEKRELHATSDKNRSSMISVYMVMIWSPFISATMGQFSVAKGDVQTVTRKQ